MNDNSNEKFYRGMSGSLGNLGRRGERDKYDDHSLLGKFYQ